MMCWRARIFDKKVIKVVMSRRHYHRDRHQCFSPRWRFKKDLIIHCRLADDFRGLYENGRSYYNRWKCKKRFGRRWVVLGASGFTTPPTPGNRELKQTTMVKSPNKRFDKQQLTLMAVHVRCNSLYISWNDQILRILKNVSHWRLIFLLEIIIGVTP